MHRYTWFRRYLPVLLLLAVVLSACSSGGTGSSPGNGESTGGSAPKESQQPAEPEKPVEIEMVQIYGGGDLPAPEKDELLQTINKTLNIDLKMGTFVSAEDYQAQLNVRLASGDFPDLFAIPDRKTYSEYAATGVLLELTPYLDQLGPLREFLGDELMETVTLGDKIYGTPKTKLAEQGSIWVRKDWLDRLQLDPPSTLEEFYQVAVAFTQQDPDGNGQKDTMGLTGNGLGTFAPILASYGLGGIGVFQEKDGEVINTLYDPAMREALQYIKSLIDAGVVDPEFITNNNSTSGQKLYEGRYGLVYIGWPIMMKDEFVVQWKGVNPDAEWVQVDALTGPGGKYVSGTSLSSNGGILGIPKALEKDPVKLQKVFDLLNYSASEEGLRLSSYGIEGKHYNMENGEVVPTELMDKEGGYFYIYQFAGRPEMEYLHSKFKNQIPYIDFANEQPRIGTLDGFINYPTDMNTADANRFIQEEMLKFMYGTNSLDQYDQFLATLEGTFGYKAIMEEAIRQLNELGFGK